MVQELKEVISKVELLDEKRQKEIAALLQEELAWDSAFDNSQEQLGKLTNEALQDFKSGKATQTDW